jgi:hypothetical protein
MTTTRRSLRTLVALAAALGSVACSDNKVPLGLGSQEVAFSRDTVRGTGELTELQQRRAAWVARGIKDYRYQLRQTCFCVAEAIRPKLLEVRGGTVARAWDLATGKEVIDTRGFPTITTLFDDAIATRASGGPVRVTYDRALGIPVLLEIGTLANDAGVGYKVGGFEQIR